MFKDIKLLDIIIAVLLLGLIGYIIYQSISFEMYKTHQTEVIQSVIKTQELHTKKILESVGIGFDSMSKEFKKNYEVFVDLNNRFIANMSNLEKIQVDMQNTIVNSIKIVDYIAKLFKIDLK